MRSYFLNFDLMRILLTPFVIVYRLYFAIVFFLVLTLLYPVFWMLLLNDKNFNTVFKLKVFTARFILLFQFIYLKEIDFPKDLKGTFVICPNHSSYLDIIIMYLILPKNKFLFVGKSELLKWPILSMFFRKIDIAVNREKRHSAMRSILRAKHELKNGWSIVIYPEGKIPLNTPELDEFKNGPFKLAIDSEIPILPISIIDSWKRFNVDPVLTGIASPGVCRFIVHEPISTVGLTKKDLLTLRNQTFDIINEPLLKYNQKYIEKS